MEKGLVKDEAAVEATEAVMVRLPSVLVFIHLPITVKVGPSLFIRQNLGGVRVPFY